MAAWHEESGAFSRSEAVAVKEWNMERLIDDLGCDEPTAALVAEAGLDWHDVAALMKRGCSLELALEILA